MAAAAVATSKDTVVRPVRSDRGPLEYSFDEQLCHRMQDETFAYVTAIRTRIELLGTRWNVTTASSLYSVMDQIQQHSSLLLPAASSPSSISKEPESKKAAIAETTPPSTAAAVVAATETVNDIKSSSTEAATAAVVSAVRWTESLLRWQQRHEELRSHLFDQMRECSLKSSVDNALFMGLFKTAQMVVPGVYIGSQSFVKSQKMLDEWGITHVVSCNGTSMLYGGRYGWCTLKMDDIEQQLLQPHLDVALEFIDRARLGRATKPLNGTTTAAPPPSATTPPPRRLSAPSAPSEAVAVATASAAAIAMATNETPLQRAERMGRGRVLIHCSAGISRSVAICIAWLMRQGSHHSATLPSPSTLAGATEIKSAGSSSSSSVPIKKPAAGAPSCTSNYGDCSVSPVSFDRCVRLMEAARPVVNPNPSFRKQLQDLERYWIKVAAASTSSAISTTTSSKSSTNSVVASPASATGIVPAPSHSPPATTTTIIGDASSDHPQTEVSAAV